ncbi:MAG: DUF2207 domain-containing protein, partial [Bacteroidota bacterium]
MLLRILAVISLLFSLCFTQVSAKSYEIPEVHIEVVINADGTVDITESLTYDYDGSYSWAQYELPKQGFSSISDIQVSEDDKHFTNENSESPGTFSVVQSDEAIRVKWYYSAEDEKRTFNISYTLKGALTVGPKWSQFFWNYLSDERDKSTSQLNISIQLPKSVSADSLFGWTRGPKGHFDLQNSSGTFTINASNIDDDEFAKVRAVFPTAVLNSSQISTTDENFSL